MDARRTMPGLNRRGFLTASAAAAAGLGAAALAVPGTAVAGTAPGGPRPSGDSLTEAVLEAFQTYRLVGLGEAHGLQEHHDLLQTLISDPRLPEVVDDIVVQFGNALYQETIDTFVLDGQPVNDADLRPLWRNTMESPLRTWDEPVYEQFFRRVRAVNWTLPPSKRIRVLLGDPPIDWSTITSQQQILPFAAQMETHPAAVVEQQVLAKGRRALLCYGAGQLFHTDGNPSTSVMVQLIEQKTGVRTYVIADLLPLQGDPGGLGTELASYSRNTVIPAAGTWLGQFNAGYATGGNIGPDGQVFNQLCGTPMGEVVDAGLYLGQPADLTASRPNPAIYLDPAYWAELERRNAILGDHLDLNTYRQQQPPGYAALSAAAC